MLKETTKIGFLGGGQLARMSAYQAFKLGLRVHVFASSENEPLVSIAHHSHIGSFEDVDALSAFFKTCDVVTLENEFLDAEIIAKAVENSGVSLYPSPESFAKIENKLIEKQTMEAAGIPVTPYVLVPDKSALKEIGENFGWPLLIKSSKGGYDGYGNAKANSLEEAEEAFDSLGGKNGDDVLAEKFIPFTKELAVQVVRNSTGIAVYPCCETIQKNHICKEVIAPAPISEELRKKAEKYAIAGVEALDGKGIFAFEFFLTESGEILFNESAPRPHNSAHYTIEGCSSSQFENHVRAVLDLPLGSTEMTKPVAVMINLLGTDKRATQIDNGDAVLKESFASLHLYGKELSKPGRKMGHATFLGENPTETLEKARNLTKNIRI